MAGVTNAYRAARKIEGAKCVALQASVTLLCALSLVACGGGGGGASTAPSQSGQSAGGSTDTTSADNASNGSSNSTGSGGSTPATPAVVTIAAVVDGPDSFDFTPKAAYADAAQRDQALGGALFAAWDPTNPKTALGTGMKVLFFGKAVGCTGSEDQGPVSSGASADFAAALQRSAAPAAGASARWTPSADTGICDASVRGEDGPSMVQLNADDANGSVAMYTAAVPGAGFLRPYDAAGQDGNGANANITGTFVAFRQPWWVADPIQPWLATSGSGAARIVSTQSVGAAVADSAGASGTNQVKQQISVTFLNTECAKAGSSAQRPCQIQYLMNTAIVRTGVSDWSTQQWFAQADVVFDPAQGGIPVVDGPIDAAGVAAVETSSGLPVWTSQGAATQHTAFANQNFDVRIGQAELLNALRIVTARKAGTTPAQVGDDAMAAMWGAKWNDPAAWVLLSSEIGQEVYNPYADRTAYIGGSFKRLYVGRAAS